MRIAKTQSEKTLMEALMAGGRSAATLTPSRARRRAVIRAAMTGSTQRPEVLGNCGICGEPIFKHFKHPHRFSASVDHIRPLARGGSNALANLQHAHLGCNSAKRDSLPGESPAAKALRRRISAR
jgi:5-methylcytosine-specific restriction endonuclease McrA